MKRACSSYLIVALILAIPLTTPATARAVPAGQKPQLRFAQPVVYESGGFGANSVAIADLNGDGIPDLVVADYCQSGGSECNGAVAVLLGNGDGTFQPPVTYSTGAYVAYSVAVGDLNGDGIPDLVVANWCQSLQYGDCAGNGVVSVLLGNGDGTFQPAVTYSSGGYYSTSIAIGDFNGDGYPDLVVANACSSSCQGSGYGSVGVLMGNGDGTFQAPVVYSTVGYVAISVAVGNITGGGNIDLIVANFCTGYGCSPAGGGYDGEAGVLLGNGDGTFQPVALYNSGGISAYSVAIGDLRGNGVQDLVVSNEFNEGWLGF